MLNCKKVIVFA